MSVNTIKITRLVKNINITKIIARCYNLDLNNIFYYNNNEQLYNEKKYNDDIEKLNRMLRHPVIINNRNIYSYIHNN